MTPLYVLLADLVVNIRRKTAVWGYYFSEGMLHRLARYMQLASQMQHVSQGPLTALYSFVHN